MVCVCVCVSVNTITTERNFRLISDLENVLETFVARAVWISEQIRRRIGYLMYFKTIPKPFYNRLCMENNKRNVTEFK